MLGEWRSVLEVVLVERRIVDRVVIKRAAAMSTRASAKLERREVPNSFVRSSGAERFLAERRKNS